MAISNSYLLGLYGGTYDPAQSAASTRTPIKKAQPTAPWSPAGQATAPKPDALLRSALSNRRLIDEGAAQLDVKGASADYKKLFALYRGLESLKALSDRSNAKGVSDTELGQIQKRFDAGLEEVRGYLSKADFDALRLVQGSSNSISKTTAAVPRSSANSVTGPIHEGALTTPVAAFAGDTRFNITIKVGIGTTATTKNVAIDLAELGDTPRTLEAVTGLINGKLADEGVQTRIGREMVKAEPRTITAGGKTITLPARPDQWALALRGNPGETVAFSAPDTSDAVYVVQSAGTTGQLNQLLKFQSDGGTAAAPTAANVGEGQWVAGRLSQEKLPDGVTAVRASAVASDGSLWLVADVSAGPGSQPIKGAQDVALLKYDTAGRLVATRTLGAASSASGFALAVNADGSVAVAGSVTGALNTSTSDAGKSGNAAGVADSFVTVFDKDGQEQWTQRRGARAADEATSVAFGADGVVYIGGRAQSGLPGTSGIGGWDGYVQAFKAGAPYPMGPITSTAIGQAQFGKAADDRVDAVAVDGSSLYTAGVESGRAVVRRFTLDATGVPTLASTRDLGAISGEIAGLSVSDGKVILTGTSRDSGLSAGQTTNANSGGKDVFVASLSTDLVGSASDRLSWYGGAGEDSAADVKVVDGKVWITGIADRPAAAKDTDPATAFLTRLNPLTGAVEYTRTWSGEGGQAKPLTLAVAKNGASVLDRLGLPQGEIAQSDSKLLTAATSLRVGDRFYISPADGARATAVTIDAKDTLATLARKIAVASNNRLTVTVTSEGGAVTGRDGEVNTTTGGLQRLSITARDGKEGAILTSGETGRDALLGLGLSSGYIGLASADKSIKTFGLGLPTNLTLTGADARKTASEKLLAALSVVRDAYRGLAPKPASTPTGPVPTYLTNQIANYQAALSRLTGS